jgi:hypothetical protein
MAEQGRSKAPADAANESDRSTFIQEISAFLNIYRLK